MKKVKKGKKVPPSIRPDRPTFNPSIKLKGELFVRVQTKKEKDNLLLAWNIKQAEANY